jgi:hypothetical protein
VDDYSNKKYVVIGSENSSTLILTRRYINLSTINPHPGNFPHILSTSFDGQFNTLYSEPVFDICDANCVTETVLSAYNNAQIGRRRTIDYYTGDIAEIIMFTRYINDQERQDIEAYLSSKYDIPLQ